jgi:hypothetical protein
MLKFLSEDMVAQFRHYRFPKYSYASNGNDRGYSRLVKAHRNSLEGRIVELATSGKLGWGARAAIRSQKRDGLPITTMRGNQVVRIFPGGRVEILETVERPEFTIPKGVKLLKRK